MQSVITEFEQKYRKSQIPAVRSGDTVRVHQKIREAGKERTQMFEGMVIRVSRLNSLAASITVRKISSGIGVEKTFPLHAPSVENVQVIRRSKVRRNLLSYIRERQGKATRLVEQAFDRDAVNVKEETKKEKSDGAKVDELEAKTEEPSNKDKAAETEAKEEAPEAAKEDTKVDKAADKKAKAEEFRKAQEAKK